MQKGIAEATKTSATNTNVAHLFRELAKGTMRIILENKKRRSTISCSPIVNAWYDIRRKACAEKAGGLLCYPIETRQTVGPTSRTMTCARSGVWTKTMHGICADVQSYCVRPNAPATWVSCSTYYLSMGGMEWPRYHANAVCMLDVTQLDPPTRLPEGGEVDRKGRRRSRDQGSATRLSGRPPGEGERAFEQRVLLTSREGFGKPMEAVGRDRSSDSPRGTWSFTKEGRRRLQPGAMRCESRGRPARIGTTRRVGLLRGRDTTVEAILGGRGLGHDLRRRRPTVKMRPTEGLGNAQPGSPGVPKPKQDTTAACEASYSKRRKQTPSKEQTRLKARNRPRLSPELDCTVRRDRGRGSKKGWESCFWAEPPKSFHNSIHWDLMDTLSSTRFVCSRIRTSRASTSKFSRPKWT